MKMNKSLTFITSITLLILVLSMAPFTAAFAKPAVKPTGELRIGVPTLHSEMLHPFWARNLRKFYYTAMYDFLVELDEEGKLAPGIAYKWEDAPDHLSWTFYIRDGVRFHDGSTLTLEDVKYSLDTTQDEKNVCVRSQFAPYYDWTEIVPPDKVVIHMKQPWAVFPYQLSPAGQGGGTILPKKYIEEKGEGFELHPIGSGPYKFLEKKEGDYIKFEAQDYHWRVGTPKYKYLTFKKLPEEGTRVAALKAGEVDVIQVGRIRAKELEEAGRPIVRKKEAVELNLDFLHTYRPDNPLSKKKVRQALVYAIDKQAIVDHIFLGQGKVVGHAYCMFTTSVDYKPYPLTPYDPKKAKQLLAEAGYPHGFKIYYYNFVTSVPEQKLVGEAIAGYWEAIGMQVEILEMEASAFFALWTKKVEPPGPAAFNHSWSTRVQPEWRPLTHSDVKKYYFSHVADPEVDRLIEEFEVQANFKDYIEASRKLMDRVLEMYYRSAICSIGVPFAVSKEVPEWNCGRGNTDCYRFEYIGATK